MVRRPRNAPCQSPRRSGPLATTAKTRNPPVQSAVGRANPASRYRRHGLFCRSTAWNKPDEARAADSPKRKSASAIAERRRTNPSAASAGRRRRISVADHFTATDNFCGRDFLVRYLAAFAAALAKGAASQSEFCRRRPGTVVAGHVAVSSCRSLRGNRRGQHSEFQ